MAETTFYGSGQATAPVGTTPQDTTGLYEARKDLASWDRYITNAKERYDAFKNNPARRQVWYDALQSAKANRESLINNWRQKGYNLQSGEYEAIVAARKQAADRKYAESQSNYMTTEGSYQNVSYQQTEALSTFTPMGPQYTSMYNYTPTAGYSTPGTGGYSTPSGPKYTPNTGGAVLLMPDVRTTAQKTFEEGEKYKDVAAKQTTERLFRDYSYISPVGSIAFRLLPKEQRAIAQERIKESAVRPTINPSRPYFLKNPINTGLATGEAAVTSLPIGGGVGGGVRTIAALPRIAKVGKYTLTGITTARGINAALITGGLGYVGYQATTKPQEFITELPVTIAGGAGFAAGYSTVAPRLKILGTSSIAYDVPNIKFTRGAGKTTEVFITGTGKGESTISEFGVKKTVPVDVVYSGYGTQVSPNRFSVPIQVMSGVRTQLTGNVLQSTRKYEGVFNVKKGFFLEGKNVIYGSKVTPQGKTYSFTATRNKYGIPEVTNIARGQFDDSLVVPYYSYSPYLKTNQRTTIFSFGKARMNIATMGETSAESASYRGARRSLFTETFKELNRRNLGMVEVRQPRSVRELYIVGKKGTLRISSERGQRTIIEEEYVPKGTEGVGGSGRITLSGLPLSFRSPRSMAPLVSLFSSPETVSSTRENKLLIPVIPKSVPRTQYETRTTTLLEQRNAQKRSYNQLFITVPKTDIPITPVTRTPLMLPPNTPVPRVPVVPFGGLPFIGGGYSRDGRRSSGVSRRGFGLSRTFYEAVTQRRGRVFVKAPRGGFTGLEIMRSFTPRKKKRR